MNIQITRPAIPDVRSGMTCGSLRNEKQAALAPACRFDDIAQLFEACRVNEYIYVGRSARLPKSMVLEGWSLDEDDSNAPLGCHVLDPRVAEINRFVQS
nr:hypothetical protein [Microbacterium sp. SS28]